jgi:hypothetical protein
VRAAGRDADAVDVGSLGDLLSRDHDGMVVGASIHMGKHDKFEDETGWRPPGSRCSAERCAARSTASPTGT